MRGACTDAVDLHELDGEASGFGIPEPKKDLALIRDVVVDPIQGAAIYIEADVLDGANN
jgi:hypothetical protein